MSSVPLTLTDDEQTFQTLGTVKVETKGMFGGPWYESGGLPFRAF